VFEEVGASREHLMLMLAQGVAQTDQTTANGAPPAFSQKPSGIRTTLIAAQAQSAAESRSHTFAKAGAIGGAIMGALDGALIWGAGGAIGGAGVGVP
jgi:hypothetical protein